jgi:hypothetical protein
VSKSKPGRLGGTSGGALIDDVERTPVLDHTKLKARASPRPACRMRRYSSAPATQTPSDYQM